MAEEKKEIHIYVKGEVQGVFFRATTKQIADSMHLKGWVKNLDNGDVEICLAGTKEEAEKLIERLKKDPKPRIDQVTMQSSPLKKDFSDFKIIY
ncbi:MAG: acylphosphatase [Simkaniaceae bacterium]